MDSINRQQPEENFESLQGSEGFEKIRELTDKSKTCFFCTNIESGRPFSTRPMHLQKVDDEGNLWFLSANDSHKNQEIAENPGVQLLFQGSDYSDFLTLWATATISEDREIIKELWNPMLKVWFTEGEEDRRISVIKVEPETGYYWDTKNNAAVGLAKRLAGAVMGKTLDDSIEGEISL